MSEPGATVAGPATPPVQSRLPAGTAMGTVRLTVSDLERSRAFYEQVVGLPAQAGPDGTARLGPDPEQPLVELFGDPSASPLERRHTGLFHLAVLLPSRGDLAHAVMRLVTARWPLDGASDHLVSEALYLSDPDGNGIEIYRDRPRDEWTRGASGELRMATLPLDLEDVLDTLPAPQRGLDDAGDPRQPSVPADARIGHVHLQVSELAEIERFYAGVLGFDVTVRSYPGALFVSAGGYHHHLGLNTWNSAGAPPPPPGTVGLRSYEILFPDAAAVEQVLARVRDAGLPAEPDPLGTLLRDPSGSRVLLRSAA